jgi:hypothetical protein
MADLAQLERALINADRAGDGDAARRLAAEIIRVRGQVTPAPATEESNGAVNFGRGLLRGARDLVDGPAYLLPKGVGMAARALGADRVAEWLDSEARRVSEINRQAEEAYQAGTPGSVAAGVGRVGGNVASSFIPGTGQVSAGNKIADLWKAGNYAKSLGAAAGLGAAQNAVLGTKTETDSLPLNAALGAVLAPAAQMAGVGAGKGVQGVRNFLAGPEGRAGRALRQAGQVAPEDLAAALRAGNTTLVEGAAPTTAQAAMNPGISQLARTVKNQGYNPLTEREAQQNAARIAALDAVAPGAVGTKSIDAAENAGNVITGRATPMRAESNAGVSAKYESMDPFNEGRVGLPVSHVDAELGKYFGEGAGSPTGALTSLVDDIRALSMPKAPAAKAAGGKTGPSVADLQSGKHVPGKPSVIYGPLARRQGGESFDGMASLLHQHGYLDDPDPKALMAALEEEARGGTVYSRFMDDDQLAYLRGMVQPEPAAAFSLPMAAESRAVPLSTLQNLRSRASEIAYVAGQAGNRRDAAVAQRIKEHLDNTLAAVAERRGGGTASADYPPVSGEYFTPGMSANFHEARRAKIEHEGRFGTGVATDLWRNSRDGLPVKQGAEVSKAFFGSQADQAARIGQFNRMLNGDEAATDALRQYGIADLAERATGPTGNLSYPKLGHWLDQRASAIPGLYNAEQQQALGTVRNDLGRAFEAENLGRATGSNTAQNLLGAGLLDSRFANVLAGVIPRLGPAGLEVARNASRQRAANEIGAALIDPEVAARSLGTFTRLLQPNAFQRGLNVVPQAAVPAASSLGADY